MSCFYQFSYVALESFTGLQEALNSWNKPGGSVPNSSLPLHERAARHSKTLVSLQAWGDSMDWLMLPSKVILHLSGQTPCILKRNFKSCGNWLQNYSRALNTRGFERISNEYGKMKKLALVTYRELWRGSSGERDVLEGYSFKYILVLLFFATFLITLFAVCSSLSFLWW